MARSPLFRLLLRLLAKHQTQQKNQSRTINRSRRRFMAGAAAGAALTPLTQMNAALAKIPGNRKPERIAIVGGGIAGLNAAYQLQKAGIKARVYEASHRLGGRIYTRTNAVAEDLLTELGAEFINTDHDDILALVNDFQLELFNRRQDSAAFDIPASAYYFAGRAWPESELADMLRPLAHQIGNDADLLDLDWDGYAPQFDLLSVTDYLNQHSSLISSDVVRDIVENGIRTEFGVEPEESSALQLLFNLPTVHGNTVEMLGTSDETFVVKHGNSKIIDGLASALAGQIHTRMQLSKLEQNQRGQYKLKFKNGKRVRADYVILAIPFSVLRKVDLEVALPVTMRDFIYNADLGRNEKVVAGFDHRAWRQEQGFSTGGWADLGFSAFWDSSQRQGEIRHGSLTYYLGANDTETEHESAEQQAGDFTKAMDKHVPGLLDASNERALRTRWTRNRWSRGSYSSFRPGQLTKFAEHFWIEADDPADAQQVRFGNLFFAGEQLSDAYYGFMNGGAETGRLAALSLLESLIQT